MYRSILESEIEANESVLMHQVLEQEHEKMFKDVFEDRSDVYASRAANSN